MAGRPIDGHALLLAAAKGSVTPRRLPGLLDRVQRGVAERHERYDRGYECAAETQRWRAYFVEEGHRAELGATMGLSDREVDGVRRAHAAHLRRAGGDRGRREEFETALELREVVVPGRDG